jgi:hypothetical protein
MVLLDLPAHVAGDPDIAAPGEHDHPVADAAADVPPRPEPRPASWCTPAVENILPGRLRSSRVAPPLPQPEANRASRRLKAASDNDPLTLQQALSSPDSASWSASMDQELASLAKNNTFTIVDTLPPGRKAIGTKWVFKTKFYDTGDEFKKKSRLCAKGFHQRYNVDFTDTYAPVLKYDSLRILLSLGAHENLPIHQADVDTAFLIPELTEEIYVTLPDGRLARLHKCLYGLKQGPLEWNQEVDSFYSSIGFTSCAADPCVYFLRTPAGPIYSGLYVDDIVTAGSTEAYKWFITQLGQKYPIKDLGIARFVLGLHLDRDNDRQTILIHQGLYAKKVLALAGLSDCTPARTPYDFALDLVALDYPLTQEIRTLQERMTYPSLIGCIRHLVNCSRPDLSFICGVLSRYQSDPTPTHWKALIQVLRYVRGTPTLGVALGGASLNPVAYCDADWGGIPESSRSTSGYCMQLGAGTVAWFSRAQTEVALSTCEAEYYGITTAAKEVIWTRNLLEELSPKLVEEPIVINEDNMSCIKILRHKGSIQRTKHLKIRHHFIAHRTKAKEIEVRHCRSAKMKADLFTKQLKPTKFHEMRGLLNMQAGTMPVTGSAHFADHLGFSHQGGQSVNGPERTQA